MVFILLTSPALGVENYMRDDPYRKMASWYDTMLAPFTASLRRKTLGLYPPMSGLQVLEVGCGTGTNLVPFHEAGCRVAGIDLSPAMIAQAQKKLTDPADLRVGDAASMPYSNDQFDLIVAMLTLHEMPSKLRPMVLQEMVRVLKTSGRMLLVDYQCEPHRTLLGWLGRWITYIIERMAGGDHFKNYQDYIARNGLPPLFTAQQLTIKKEASAANGNIALYLLGV